MISRRVVLAGLSAASCLARPAAAAPVERSNVHIGVGGKASLYYLPLTVAERLSYFSGEGLQIQFSDFAGGSKTMQALVGGSIDIASGAYEHVVSIQPKGQNIRAFVAQGRYPNFAFGISKTLAATYKSPRDLKAARIGVTAPGSGSQTFAEVILGRGGLNSSDVSFIGVGSGASAVAAMRYDRVDAISNLDPAMTLLEQAGDTRIIYDTRTTAGTNEVFGGPMPAGCLYTREEFVKANPNTVQALATAMVRALVWLRTASGDDVARIVPEAYLGGDKALYISAYEKGREGISTDGRIGPEGAQNILKMLMLADPALKPDQVDLSRTYTDAFVEKALASAGG